MTQLDILEQHILERAGEERPQIFDSGAHVKDDQLAPALDDIVEPFLQFLHFDGVQSRIVPLPYADVVHLEPEWQSIKLNHQSVYRNVLQSIEGSIIWYK